MSKSKVALITGITGQDGAYLAELLLKKGYEVHGIKRRASLFNTDRIDHLYHDPHIEGNKLTLHHGDLTDSSCLIRIIQQTQPDEIYNLAAQSHVAVSFEEPEYTANSDVHCVFWKRSASSNLRKRPASIKHLLPSSMAWYKKSHKKKLHPSIHVAHTQLQNYMPTGSQ